MMNKNAQALINACEKNLTANEYNCRKFKGVANCSASDILCAQMYAETILKNGRYSGLLMPPRGNVAEILEKSHLLEE